MQSEVKHSFTENLFSIIYFLSLSKLMLLNFIKYEKKIVYVLQSCMTAFKYHAILEDKIKILQMHQIEYFRYVQYKASP